jgi:tRNA-2-methylthio-N6-dimethylallyladenosine synthase
MGSLVLENKSGNTKKLFIESYGCAIVSLTVRSWLPILSENGYNYTGGIRMPLV